MSLLLYLRKSRAQIMEIVTPPRRLCAWPRCEMTMTMVAERRPLANEIFSLPSRLRPLCFLVPVSLTCATSDRISE